MLSLNKSLSVFLCNNTNCWWCRCFAACCCTVTASQKQSHKVLHLISKDQTVVYCYLKNIHPNFASITAWYCSFNYSLTVQKTIKCHLHTNTTLFLSVWQSCEQGHAHSFMHKPAAAIRTWTGSEWKLDSRLICRNITHFFTHRPAITSEHNQIIRGLLTLPMTEQTCCHDNTWTETMKRYKDL